MDRDTILDVRGLNHWFGMGEAKQAGAVSTSA
jgi:hypothetical protein